MRSNVDFLETSLTQSMASKGTVRALAYPNCEGLKSTLLHSTGKCKNLQTISIDMTHFQAVLGDAKLAAKKISRLTSPSVCGTGGTSSHMGLEYDDVGSIRVGFKGERHCAWIRIDALQHAMSAKGDAVSDAATVRKNAIMAQAEEHQGEER